MTSALIKVEAVEAQKLNELQSIENQIAIAEQEAQELTFEYSTKKGNSEARSYLASLRKFNGKIDRAHKEVKEVHLQRGRAVDAVKNRLKDQVAKLIQPHAAALEAIECAEAARIEAHRSKLKELESLAAVETAAQAAANADLARDFDIENFEEFADEAFELRQKIWNHLVNRHAELVQQENERAELESLRAAEAERQERERQEQLRQEGERRAAERLAQQQRDELARSELAQRQAEQRAQEAQREAAAAKQRAEEAERREQERAAELERQERERQERQEQAALRMAELRVGLIHAIHRQITTQKLGAMAVAAAIADGTLHPAITIDWTAVQLESTNPEAQ